MRHQVGVPGRMPESANDDPGATAVRPVVPRYVLRGVSGAAFGRSYPIHGSTTAGRSPECDLCLDEAGLSRVHARLMPTDEGVLLEDLGSTNGTFLNGKRVLRGEARTGDEIGFDTLRFRLIAPGQADASPEARTLPGSMPQRAWVVAAGIAVVVAMVLVFAFR